MKGKADSGFSIVLCTYNGRSRLEPTLSQIAQLQLSGGLQAELIVVNNASTDDTVSFIYAVWQKVGAPFSLRIINEERPGKGYAVETGYDAASYSYIVTVDDDNWLENDYLISAYEIFERDRSIGVLQGHSTGVFEQEPPAWIKNDNLEHFFVIGAPTANVGYYNTNDFGAWGAGMVIKKADWDYLRSIGFTFLTSKLPGKAAGEDHELAIAILLMGKKIYYSDKLKFQHYMPSDRLHWNKLKQNFETFGYVSRYNFLYALVIDAHRKGYTLDQQKVRKSFWNFFHKSLCGYTWKQHLAYWLYPRQEYYQLRLHQYYAQCRWFIKLSPKNLQDLTFLQKWMLPLLKQEKSKFTMDSLYRL